MEAITIKDDDFFAKNLLCKFSVFSANIYKINISKDEYLTINVYLKLMYPRGKYLNISFLKVKEYSFSWNENYIFYNIETLKFFKKDDLFYISFDPDGSDDTISKNDQDFIISESIEGILSCNMDISNA